jgi:hypothetical protein
LHAIGADVSRRKRQFACNTNTQSESPSLLLPGDVKFRVPVLANGEPETVKYVPAVGSNHQAVAGPLSWVIFTLMVLAVGT